MPTLKKRINVTLPDHIAVFLQSISLRDDMPQSQKIVELLDGMLEIEEDAYWDKRAAAVEKKNKGWLTQQQFWKGLL